MEASNALDGVYNSAYDAIERLCDEIEQDAEHLAQICENVSNEFDTSADDMCGVVAPSVIYEYELTAGTYLEYDIAFCSYCRASEANDMEELKQYVSQLLHDSNGMQQQIHEIYGQMQQISTVMDSQAVQRSPPGNTSYLRPEHLCMESHTYGTFESVIVGRDRLDRMQRFITEVSRIARIHDSGAAAFGEISSLLSQYGDY